MTARDASAAPHRSNQIAAATTTALLVAALGYACAKLAVGLLPHGIDDTPLEPTQSSASSGLDTGASAFERTARASLFGDATIAPEIVEPEVDTTAPVTTLNLRLLGILATNDDQPAFAIINGGSGGEQVLGVGDDIENAVLREIHHEHVIIENRGKRERLELPKLDLASAITTVPSSAAQAAEPVQSNASDGSLVDVNDLPQTPGALRDYLVRNPATMQQLVSIGAYRENGKVIGYRLMPKQDTAILRNYGIEPGDVVTSLNGVRLDNQRRGLKALRQLVTASNIDMTVLRNGAEIPISIALQ